MKAWALCECGCGQRTNIAPANNTRHGYVKGKPYRFLRGHHLRGRNHHNWQGGRKKHGTGYVMVLAKDHPRANLDGYVMEHIVVAERVLGRYLANHNVVHHVNGKKNDNRPENLVICEDQAYHLFLHRRQRARNRRLGRGGAA